MKQAAVVIGGVLALVAGLFVDREARAETEVDLELVLAVDISLSMQPQEQRLQRDGYVAAFRDPAVIKAIGSGLLGRIAVTYVEWAGEAIQSVVVPWQIVASAKDAYAFANKLAAAPIRRARMTSISGALAFSAALFDGNGISGLKRVIDVSGDGPNNIGPTVESARDALVQRGITINGLALVLNPPHNYFGYFEIPELDRYYKDCVVGGPSSFALAIRKRSEFATATRQKLLLEISGITPEHDMRPKRVQFTPKREPYDCLIGEKLWQQFLMDGFTE